MKRNTRNKPLRLDTHTIRALGTDAMKDILGGAINTSKDPKMSCTTPTCLPQ